MATGLILKTPLEQVFSCIDNNQSFILEAGAGSGKTWTLIESIKYILDKFSNEFNQNNQYVVCITYTNVAKDEIIKRLDNNPLVIVRTIHEFLWETIEKYQTELRKVLFEFNNTVHKSKIDNLEENLEDKITYSLYGRKFEKGRITHEDVIEFSYRIYKQYPKILRIVKHKYPYIFTDEYQDTEPRTIEILIDCLLNSEKKEVVIGFFGDYMQKIYNQGIGRIENPKLERIKKEDNYRCSKRVISVLNKIRTDLHQTSSGNNKEGEVIFMHYNSLDTDEQNYLKAVEFLIGKKNWQMKVTKILMLTHKGIASKLEYTKLLALYEKMPFGKDRLFNKEDIFIKFLVDKVETLSSLYDKKQYGAFINLLGMKDFKLNWHSEKIYIKGLMSKLEILRETGSIKDVFKLVFETNLLVKPERIMEYEKRINRDELTDRDTKDKEFYDLLMNIEYKEIINFCKFINESTPFSTKHGTKGTEYQNVLIVVDNSWNQYNFNSVFSQNKSKISIFERSLNLLYVCCSRAKDKLAILSLVDMDEKAKINIEDWFSMGEVHKL